MMFRARERWAGLSADDRDLLEWVFDDAVINPIRVGFIGQVAIRIAGLTLYCWHFRFGYCHYIIYDARPALWLFDLWIDDIEDEAIAA